MAAFSADLRTVLAAHLDELADAVLERFAAGGGPEGAPDAATLRNLRVGARAAAVCFVARLGGERAPADLDLFVAHGRAQQAAGRTLTELLSFYRLGGLAMWERSTALLPEGAIVVDEALTSGGDLPAATAGSPRHDWLTLTGGAIGYGLPVATGAAVACPDRPVVGCRPTAARCTPSRPCGRTRASSSTSRR